ncbi:MAG: hypothetical protein ABSF93_00090 [Candidatus Sulfotelmatobacter sp.]
MFRPCVCCMLLCLGTLSSAQNSSAVAQTSPTPVQVVYLVESTTIVTYNVDPQTLNPTQVGSVTVPNAVFNPDVIPWLIAAPNDHFIYYIGYVSQTQQRLWVFATDSTGSPQLPVVQQFNVKNFNGLQVDPKANFVYAVFEGVNTDDSYNTPWYIRRYLINPASGKLNQPQLEATYALGNGAEGTAFCGLSLLGFKASGTSLYDEVQCSAHGTIASYNERTVNLTSGALGDDVEVYSWQNGNSGGYESVQFAANRLFDFVVPFDYAQGYDSVNIYPVVPSTSTPLLTCTADMLEACGSSAGLAHPSGKYVFMAIASDLTQIDKVELSQKKIVDSSNYVPYWVTQFSPDGTLVYGVASEYSTDQLMIYGFNVATSEVTPGGYIYLPSTYEGFFTAERQ